MQFVNLFTIFLTELHEKKLPYFGNPDKKREIV